jgi:glycosidase
MKLKTFSLLVLMVFATLSCTQNSQEIPNAPLTSVVHPEWVKNATMYEVNIRQYTPEGTFNAFAAHLPRLKELGVDILWLMPIHPIGEVNRKGSLGSYYSVKDYKGINPEFGNMDDFKTLVRMTHDLGMFLVIDWVPNHSAWDNPLVNEHPEWYAKDSTGNMFSPFDWTDVVQFDYDQQGLRDYMTETLQWWLNVTGIDGFRFDVAHQVPIDFWNDLRPDLQKARPDVLMLAEAESRALHEKAFDITYAWEFHHISNSVAKNDKSVEDIRVYFEKSEREYNENDIRMYFTSNHDENSWNGTVWERLGPAAEIMAVLTYGIPGMPLIYSGQEAGLDHRLLFFEKDEIPWKDHPFTDLYKNLNRLKEQNPALWNPGFGGDMTEISNDQPDQVLSFRRQKGDNEVMFIFNLSDKDVVVNLNGMTASTVYTDFSNNQTEALKKPSFELKAWEYKIFYL